MTETPEQMFWRLIRDGYPYEEAARRRLVAHEAEWASERSRIHREGSRLARIHFEREQLKRELIARGGQP